MSLSNCLILMSDVYRLWTVAVRMNIHKVFSSVVRVSGSQV
jgi:hypothetical protein